MSKRVNFNMADECHALLKSVCALKGVSVSEYCYDTIATEFKNEVYKNPQIRTMFLAADYPIGSRAYNLKKQVLSDFPSE